MTPYWLATCYDLFGSCCYHYFQGHQRRISSSKNILLGLFWRLKQQVPRNFSKKNYQSKSFVSKVTVIFNTNSLSSLFSLNYFLTARIESASYVTWFWKNAVVCTEISDEPAFCISPENGCSKFLRNVGTHIPQYLLTYSMEQSPSWEANWFCS